jgi:hypothetical protein
MCRACLCLARVVVDHFDPAVAAVTCVAIELLDALGLAGLDGVTAWQVNPTGPQIIADWH